MRTCGVDDENPCGQPCTTKSAELFSQHKGGRSVSFQPDKKILALRSCLTPGERTPFCRRSPMRVGAAREIPGWPLSPGASAQGSILSNASRGLSKRYTFFFSSLARYSR